jgi:hypothetical protein
MRSRAGLRVWHLMAAVLAAGLFLAIIATRDTGFTGAVGAVDIHLVFRVCELGTGKPVDGATVLLADPDYIDDPKEPYVIGLKTDADGCAEVAFESGFDESRGVPSGRLRYYRLRYPHWQIKVVATGYQSADAWFRDYEMGDSRYRQPGPPPPVVIRLRRLR